MRTGGGEVINSSGGEQRDRVVPARKVHAVEVLFSECGVLISKTCISGVVSYLRSGVVL